MAVRDNHNEASQLSIKEQSSTGIAPARFARTGVIDVVDVLWHLLGAAFTLSVFAWHFSEQATKLPGARGFGWFFKFLTFWGWTLQTVQYTSTALFLCVPRKAKAWPSLARLVDDISCVAFTVAMTVFLQFWVLHWVTGGLVERSQDRPPWLGFVMHVINGVLAVSDVLISNPRTFSRRSRVMLFSFAGMYGTLLATCRYINKKYPYPFMNKMDPILVYLIMLVISMVVMLSVSLAGTGWAWACSRVLCKSNLLLEEQHSESDATGKHNNGKARKQA